MSLSFGSPAVAPSLIGYRPEIDGLRALAVAVVVLYHAHLQCPGGYVGVDVFYVISGYLITSLLLRDLQAGRFSFLDFWERRLRRILPALMVMVMITVGVGYFLLLPSDYEQLGKSVLASALMVANVFFWRDDSTRGGYFGPTSEERPLLHTWSLSVEEQFYILFPLVLWGLFRFERLRKPAVLTLTLAAGVLVGLGLAMYGVASRPGATFYLLPTRAWELLAGALLASLSTGALPRRRLWRESAAWVGLAGVLLPCWLYTKSTPFPGLAALPPCAGAVLFIWGNAPVPGVSAGLTYAGRILAWRPVVFIGLLSYSLYLWHWPVLVIGKYWWISGTSLWYLNAGLVLVAMCLAVLSWRYVETPFRRKQLMASRSAIFCLAAVSTLVSLLLGASLVLYRGLPTRLPGVAVNNDRTKENVLTYDRATLNDAQTGSFISLGTSENAERPSLILWGDSHAGHTAPAIESLCRELGLGGIAVCASASPPLLNCVFPKFTQHGLGANLPEFSAAVLEYIKRRRIPHVVLAARWGAYQEANEELLVKSLKSTIHTLHEAGCQVWVLQDVPDVNAMAYKQLAYESMFGRSSGDWWRRSVKDHQQKNSALYKLADEGLPAIFLDPSPLLVDQSSDRYRADIEGVSIYFDDNHLTKTASVALLLPLFRQAMAEKLMATPSGEPVGDK
jgi:peptidoglycan/LPS O-acetylase OafA/YrhL